MTPRSAQTSHDSPHSSSDDCFITTRQLARRWGLSVKTLERWRREGRDLPASRRLGGTWRFLLSDVLAFEAQSKV